MKRTTWKVQVIQNQRTRIYMRSVERMKIDMCVLTKFKMTGKRREGIGNNDKF